MVVTIAGITAKCETNCDFEWIDSQTPTVDSIDTSNIKLKEITSVIEKYIFIIFSR